MSRDLFPGRKSKRELKKTSESSHAQTLRGCGLAGNKFNKRRRILLPRERKLHARRSLEFTEGIGLILPREIPEAARIALQAMFRFRMIRECRFEPGFPLRSGHRELWALEGSGKSRKFR